MNRDAIINTCLFDAPRRREAIRTWPLVLVVVSHFRPSAPTRSRRPLIERTLRPVRQRQGSQGSITLSITGRCAPRTTADISNGDGQGASAAGEHVLRRAHSGDLEPEKT